MKQPSWNRSQIALAATAVATVALAACGGGDDASTSDARSSPLAAGVAVQQGVTLLTKVSETRVSRTVYDFVYKVKVQNGSVAMRNVKAKLTAAGSGTTVVDGDVVVGDVDSNEAAAPSDTITIRHDRSVPFDPAALAWQVSGDEDTRPAAAIATWFGVTNHHYQIGGASFIQDGQVSNYVGGELSNTAAVDKVWTALTNGGATEPTHIFIGHDHTPDHSRDTPVWVAKFPNVKVVAPKSQCDRLVSLNISNECISLTPDMSDGKFVITMGQHVNIRPVKWKHADHSGCTTVVNTTPTWGYLISVETRKGNVHIFANDSGSGNDLDKDIVDPATGTYLAPIKSLANAMSGAGATRLDLWQGGSETRVIKQARVLFPLYHPKAFQPQHWAERNMLAGIPYDYFPGPTFTQFLADNNVAVVKQQNYFDAVIVDTTSTRRHPNAAVKAEWGLPADGAGPGPVGPHPRLATIPSGECELD